MKKFIISIFLIILLLFISLFVQKNINSSKNSNDGNQLITIRIPDTPFMALLPLYVAADEGIFEKYGLKVEWIDVANPGEGRALVLSGKADLTLSTFANLLAAESRESGHIKLLLPFYEAINQPASYLLMGTDTTLKIDKLYGKKIGTYTGPSQKAYAKIVLHELGYNMPSDIDIIQVSTSAQIQSLFGGVFDVLFTVEPYGSTALSKGAIALDSGIRPKYIANPFWVGAVAISTDFVKNNEGITDRINTIFNETLLYMEREPEKVRDILVNRCRISPEIADGVALYTWVANPTREDINEIQDHSDLLFEYELIMRPIRIENILSTIY